MKRIYVAGAYSDTDVIRVLRNIGRGQEWSAKLFFNGFAPFSPWLDKEYVISLWRKELPVELFYDYSMKWLEVSDAVFVIPNEEGMKTWEESYGVGKELERARALDIPIFYDFDTLMLWKDSGQSTQK